MRRSHVAVTFVPPQTNVGIVGSTTIRRSEEAKERLDGHGRDGETYDDVILRSTERDRWAAFGIADGDATDGHQRVRDAVRRRSDERVDEYRE